MAAARQRLRLGQQRSSALKNKKLVRKKVEEEYGEREREKNPEGKKKRETLKDVKTLDREYSVSRV